MSLRSLGPVLLALLLTTSGCLGVIDSRPPSDDRAVDLRDRVGESIAGVESYRFDSFVSVAAADGESSRSVTADGEGAVNHSTKHIRSVAETDGEERRGYVVDYTAYRECSEPWDGWGVEDLDEETPWRHFAPLGRTFELLNQSRVYWRGTETVNSTETAVVVAHPTAEAFSSVADRPDASVSTRGLQNATLTVWVDRETALPVRSRLEIDVKRGGATAGATVTTDYVDYGEPVTVSVPDSVYTDRHELGCPGA